MTEKDLPTDLPIEYQDLSGGSWLYREEVDKLKELLPPRGKMLEVGSADGVTASLVAKHHPEARVISVDSYPPCPGNGRFPSSLARISNWRKNQNHNQHLWVGTLSSFHEFNRIMFDLIFIDADHFFKYVFDDLLYSTVLLENGGKIAVHDYVGMNWPQVKEATDLFCSSKPFRIIEIVRSMAILEVIK